MAEREPHTLKTASATVGAREMSAACAALEEAAHRGDLSSYPASVDALRAELDAVARALSEEVGVAL
jgi:HPt (histidine-containing phosphotransfer) domain-containing protein